MDFNNNPMPKKGQLPDYATGKRVKIYKEIKWNFWKALIFLMVMLIPYMGLVYIASGISKGLVVYLIVIPILVCLGFYFLYRITKDL